MKHKLLIFNAMLFLGFGLLPMHGQTTMQVRTSGGAQTSYTLSSIRKLTFPSTGNMVVANNLGTTDNYSLSSPTSLMFSDMSTALVPLAEVKGNFQLFPNPVQDILNIQLKVSDNNSVTIELISIDAKVLYKTQLTGSSSYQINVSQLRQGIYLCRVNNGTSIEIAKFFKK